MAGRYTSAADTVVGAFADKEAQQRIRIGMQNWGYATAGTGTLPANPVGFINVTVNGVAYKVPYYNL